MKKTLGELVDELGIVNIKIFMLIDGVMHDNYTKEDAKRVQELNLQRSKLKNAINEFSREKQEIKV
jgi:hypothetical protein